jgi:hypothetical protein
MISARRHVLALSFIGLSFFTLSLGSSGNPSGNAAAGFNGRPPAKPLRPRICFGHCFCSVIAFATLSRCVRICGASIGRLI